MCWISSAAIASKLSADQQGQGHGGEVSDCGDGEPADDLSEISGLGEQRMNRGPDGADGLSTWPISGPVRAAQTVAERMAGGIKVPARRRGQRQMKNTLTEQSEPGAGAIRCRPHG
jgi:hypothetical protein